MIYDYSISMFKWILVGHMYSLHHVSRFTVTNMGTHGGQGMFLYTYFYVYGLSWDPTFVETGGLGGSEEAVVYLAQAMVDLGYNVTVYGEMSGGAFSGVLYQHISMFNVLDPGDIFIAWRYPLSMELGKFAKVKLLWLHDILKSHLFPSNVSSYVCKSGVKP